MATQILRINPFDTFFFRDGKPFSAGDDTWADGIFPPSPSVIYGALRTAWISEQPGGFTPENIKASEKLKIKGIFLELSGQTIVFPTPLDFVREKSQEEDEDSERFVLDLETKRVFSKGKLKLTALYPNVIKYIKEFDTSSYVLRKINFSEYLNNKNTERILPTKTNTFLANESKIGIGRNVESHTTSEGKLYRVDMKRFKNDETSFIVEYEGLNFKNFRLARLGGEAKFAKIDNEITKDIKINAPNFSENSKCFKLYLATPSVFKHEKGWGWLPNWINDETLIGEINLPNGRKLKLQLKSTVLGKPINVGGFGYSLEKNRFEPKYMYKAVPAGSIYYFEILEGTIQDVIDRFHCNSLSSTYQSISEINPEQGFGVTYIGL